MDIQQIPKNGLPPALGESLPDPGSEVGPLEDPRNTWVRLMTWWTHIQGWLRPETMDSDFGICFNLCATEFCPTGSESTSFCQQKIHDSSLIAPRLTSTWNFNTLWSFHWPCACVQTSWLWSPNFTPFNWCNNMPSIPTWILTSTVNHANVEICLNMFNTLISKDGNSFSTSRSPSRWKAKFPLPWLQKTSTKVVRTPGSWCGKTLQTHRDNWPGKW